MLAGNAPDATWQDGDVIKALHPLDNGQTFQADTPHFKQIVTDFEEAKERDKSAGKQLAEAKAKLCAAIGDNTWINTGTQKYSYKHQKRRTKASVEEKDEVALEASGVPFNISKKSEFRVLRKEKIK